VTVTSPSYELSDDQWAQIANLLPANGKRGGPWKDYRLMIDGILWVLSEATRYEKLAVHYLGPSGGEPEGPIGHGPRSRTLLDNLSNARIRGHSPRRQGPDSAR
jgi:hypothetical protein